MSFGDSQYRFKSLNSLKQLVASALGEEGGTEGEGGLGRGEEITAVQRGFVPTGQNICTKSENQVRNGPLLYLARCLFLFSFKMSFGK